MDRLRITRPRPVANWNKFVFLAAKLGKLRAKLIAELSKRRVKLADDLAKQGRLSEAWTVLEKVPPDQLGGQKLRTRIRYSQGNIVAARQEAAKHDELLARSLRGVHLRKLFDECLRRALADDEEPKLSKWLWPRLNLPASSKADWLVKLRWGMQINKLIGKWIRANCNQLDELYEIVEPPDLSLLAAVKADKRPVLLAGAHLGPVSLGTHYLDRAAIPYVLLAGGLPRNFAVTPFLVANESHSILELRRILSTLGTVYVAIDGRHGRSSYPATLFGSPIYLREGAAALARLSKAQTFWYAAHWVDHRIRLDLVPGPVALQDETRKAWNARWFSFCMAEYESLILAGPENIRDGKFLRLFVDE
jgi:hypothetical protein